MNPNTCLHFISLCFAARQAALFVAQPGVGKSTLPFDYCRMHNLGCIIRRAMGMDVIDTYGLPDLESEYTLFKRPGWMPNGHGPPNPTEGIIFIDELLQAVPAIQALLMEVFEKRPDGSRWLGGHKIPENWVPMAAANRLIDKAAVHRMPTQIISRLAIVELENDVDAGIEWALSGKPQAVPKYRPATDHSIRPEIIGFWKEFPKQYNNFDPSKIKDNEPYACPRSYHRLSDFLNVCEENGIGYEPPKNAGCYVSDEFVAAFIGKSAAQDFNAWNELRGELPSREEILLNPMGAKVPEKPSFCYVVAAMLGRCVTHDNIDNVLRYLGRMNKKFEVMAMQTMVSLNYDRKEKLADKTWKDPMMTKAFLRWAEKNQEIMGCK